MPTQKGSPIAALPTETLSNIFVLSISQTLAHDEPIYPLLLDKTNSPDVLAQVSRRWREVALSMPELWSRITLSPHPRAISMYLQHKQQDKDTTRGCFERWLERSKNASLYIDLNPNLHVPDEIYASFLIPSLLDALERHVNRLRDLRVTETKSPHNIAIERPDITAPRLERVVLRPSVTKVGWIPIQVSLFKNAPKLSHLSLPVSYTIRIYGLPWHQLTHLNIDDQDYQGPQFFRDLPAIFAKCRNLVTLRANIASSGGKVTYDDSGCGPRAILLPKLQSLAILGRVDIVEFLVAELSSSSSLPKLRTLVINCEADHTFSQRLLFFVRLHSDTLRHLYLHGAPKPGLSPSVFYQICSSLPRLTKLSLNAYILSVPLATALTLRPSPFVSSTTRTLEGGLNPFISSFTMVLPPNHQNIDVPLVGGTLLRGPYAAAVEGVAFMVQSRWRLPQSITENGSAARLEEVSLEKSQWDWMARSAPNAYARIKACVGEGLRLSFDVEDDDQLREFDWYL